MDRLDDLDVVSDDVLSDLVRKLDEQQWMLRAHASLRFAVGPADAPYGSSQLAVEVDCGADQ
jgi:hypothetical protein